MSGFVCHLLLLLGRRRRCCAKADPGSFAHPLFSILVRYTQVTYLSFLLNSSINTMSASAEICSLLVSQRKVVSRLSHEVPLQSSRPV
ncbi:hypothetical protein BJ170DRAFT_163556 [Xylariales sp. AK1849]|nr:hypothetical protein BJ170DRAFT_163556 [Xylariales sp. AK1849]